MLIGSLLVKLALKGVMGIHKNYLEDKEERETGTGRYSPEALEAARQMEVEHEELQKRVREERERELLQRQAIEQRRQTYSALIHWTFRCIPRSATSYHGGNKSDEIAAQMLGACEAYREFIGSPMGNAELQGETYDDLKRDYMRFLGGAQKEICLANRNCKATELTEEEAHELICKEISSKLGNVQFRSAWEEGRSRVTSQVEGLRDDLQIGASNPYPALAVIKRIGLG